MLSWLLAQQIGKLFVMMGLGFLLVKTKLMKSEDSKSLSSLALYLVMPCVILSAFQVEATADTRNGLLLAFGAAIAVHILLLFVSWVLKKLFRLDGLERASAIYSNAGNLVIPIVSAVLGPEWVIYTSAFIATQLFLLWTHGWALMSGTKKLQWRKIFLNQNLLAACVGVVMFLTNWRFPAFLGDVIGGFSSMVGPLCMVISGMLMANTDWKALFRRSSLRLYFVVFLRMIACPLVVLLFLKFSGAARFVPDGETILLITLLAAATPPAATIVQLAQIEDNRPVYANLITLVSTLVCILTMPLMAWIYQL